MKSFCTLVFALVVTALSAQRPKADTVQTSAGPLVIQPIYHATIVFTWNKKTIYVDPHGGKKALEGLAAPDLILITDIHPDHLDLETLKLIDTKKTKFIVPQAVADKMPEEYKKQIIVVANNQSTMQQGITFKAIPMYNVPEEPDSKHPKGRGNGYVFNLGGKTIYISGDTGDTQEMRDLKNIDIAFVCMNLPYTMDVPMAAENVLVFKPKIVYPYHYRGMNGLSDVELFRNIVKQKGDEIEVRLRNWYGID